MKTPEKNLFEALRENLSPQAVALIAAHLQGARCDEGKVNGEVRWFEFQLIEALGGYEAQDALIDELGL